MTEKVVPSGASEPGRKAQAIDEQLADLLTMTIVTQGWKFYASDQELSPAQVAGPKEMLPAILWQVEKMYQVAYGGGSTGVQYLPDAQGTIGATAVLPAGKPRSPMALFALEVLERARENFPYLEGATIDHVVQEFMDDHEAGLIPWMEGTARAPDFSGMRQGN